MRRRYILFIIGSVLVFAFAITAFVIFTGPAYSLYKSRKAIEKHDFQQFLKYVNLDSVISNYDFKMSVIQPEPEDTLEKLELELGMGILYGLKPQMTKIIKKQIRNSVERGYLDYLFDNKNEHLKLESKAPDKWKKWNSIRFNNIDYVNKTGDFANVGVKCITVNTNKEFTFRLRMRKTENHWQIVELTDFPKLKNLIE